MQTEIHIDKTGRIVIPKEIREEWGISPDRPLVMEVTPDGLVLRPKREASMVQMHGMWVYDVPESSQMTLDIPAFIDAVRDER